MSEQAKQDVAAQLKSSLEAAEESPTKPSRTPAECGVPAVPLNRLGAPKPWSTGICGCCDQGLGWWCKNVYFCSCCNLARANAIATKSNYVL